jgi:radical SAM PhpK family P-methyltransferase
MRLITSNRYSNKGDEMGRFAQLDCVIVGHNETNFSEYAEAVKPLDRISAAYMDAKSNSILLDGKRITYMDLMNHAIGKATGEPSNYSSFGTPSQAVCYLASFLRKRGFSVETVNLFRFGKDRLKELLAEQPAAVALTTTFYVDPTPIQEMVRWIRKHSPNTKIIVGGPFVFKAVKSYQGLALDRGLSVLGADIYVVESQGELTLSRVLQVLKGGGDLAKIPNLVYYDRHRRAQRTSTEAEDNSLEDERINWSKFAGELSGRSALVRTARSCAFKCSFCAYPLMAGKLVTEDVKSVEYELRELQDLGVRYIHFIDDTFNVPLGRFKDLCRMMIDNNFGFKWTSFFRCGNADDEQIDLAAQSGCIGVELGIESADDGILNTMNKRVTRAKYIEKTKRLHQAGIMTYAMLFVGFPGETEETVRNTISFLDETRPTFYICGVWYNDVMAPIQQRAQEFGLSGAGYSWRHNSMDWKEASDWVKYLYSNVQSSVVMPLMGFSFETITYLLGQGMSIDKIKGFTRIAHDMVIKTLDDKPVDLTAQTQMLVSLFGERTNELSARPA